MPTAAAHSPSGLQMQRVGNPEDIEYLVKESEVLTGLRGRIFVIAGADRLFYRVHWHPKGYTVERLDDRLNALCTQHLPLPAFLEHSVIEALQVGQLYTPTIRR